MKNPEPARNYTVRYEFLGGLYLTSYAADDVRRFFVLTALLATAAVISVGIHQIRTPPPVYEQRRVDLATFRALPASTWGHCSQVLCFTIVWDTPEKEKVAKWSPAPASILEGFNEIYVVYGPKKPYKTRENAKVAKSTRVCPPTPPPPPA